MRIIELILYLSNDREHVAAPWDISSTPTNRKSPIRHDYVTTYFPVPLKSQKSSPRPQQICLWLPVYHGWRVTFIRGAMRAAAALFLLSAFRSQLHSRSRYGLPLTLGKIARVNSVIGYRHWPRWLVSHEFPNLSVYLCSWKREKFLCR